MFPATPLRHLESALTRKRNKEEMRWGAFKLARIVIWCLKILYETRTVLFLRRGSPDYKYSLRASRRLPLVSMKWQLHHS